MLVRTYKVKECLHFDIVMFEIQKRLLDVIFYEMKRFIDRKYKYIDRSLFLHLSEITKWTQG